MEEQFKIMMLNALQKTGAGIEKAVDFVGAEAPTLIKECLEYYLVFNIINIITMLITLVVLSVVLYKTFNKAKGLDYSKHTDLKIILFIVSGVLSVMLMGAGHTIQTLALEAIKIKIAPRVFLIEKTREMIRETNNPNPSGSCNKK